MRFALGCLLIVAGVGCKGVGHPVASCPPGGPATCAAHAHAAGDDCPLHAAGHPCPVCDKKKEKAKDRAAPRPGPEEEQAREAVVTQDIMLIPRMVYVPYGPQVPVNPARLGTVVPGGRAVDVPRSLDTTPRGGDTTPKAADTDKVCETIDRCTMMMQVMDKRICDLESRLKNPPPAQPIVIQQAPSGPRCLGSLFCKPHIPCLGPAQ